MTMVPSLRSPAGGRTRVAAAVWMALVLLASVSFAEEPPVHFWHADAMPPGAIGQGQLTRGGPLPGYFQPVEILAPQGARVSMAEPGRFQKPLPGPLGVGLLIGQVYRLKLTNIPGYEGAEVYPTIEIIDRLYPPVGQEMRLSDSDRAQPGGNRAGHLGPVRDAGRLSGESQRRAADRRAARRANRLPSAAGRKPADRGRSLGPPDGHSSHRRASARCRWAGRGLSLRLASLAEISAGPCRAAGRQAAGPARQNPRAPCRARRPGGICRRWARRFRGGQRRKSTSPPASSRATIPCQPTSASERTWPGRSFYRLPPPAPAR